MPAFVAEMARDSARLLELATGDAGLLAEHAHAMRGKCAMFGEEVLLDLLSRLEICARKSDQDAVFALITDILARARQLSEYGPTNAPVTP